jgi:hypothetical protein
VTIHVAPRLVRTVSAKRTWEWMRALSSTPPGTPLAGFSDTSMTRPWRCLRGILPPLTAATRTARVEAGSADAWVRLSM